jgi:hypothetical protein
MSLFKRPLAGAALAKQPALRLADEAKIVELQRERAAALVETDDVATIEAIDLKVAEARRRVSICRDRIVALEAHEAAERREAACAEAIRLIQKRLAAREKVAEDLETAIRKTGDLFLQLVQSESVAPLWPFGPVPGALVDVDVVRREVGWAMFSAGKPSGGRTIFPGPTNAGLGVSGVHAIGVAAVVANQSNALLSLLHTLPLGEDDAAEDDVSAETVSGPHGLAGLATA